MKEFTFAYPTKVYFGEGSAAKAQIGRASCRERV